jgi:hypothetical protein
MDSNVHPLIVALVLLLTGVAVGTWMWGSGAAANIGGPAELKTGPNGHHYVQVRNYLIEHDESGRFLKTHSLGRIDVEVFLGSFGFFSNGDVLLRRGPDTRSFADNIRAYGRQENKQSLNPETLDSGLFRCDLEAETCKRFGQGIDFKAAHGIYIDWQTNDVYISDTTRHVLRKYSEDGSSAAGPASGFRFPNQLMLHDDQLLVIDTNNHVVRGVDPGNGSFGNETDRMDVVPREARTDGRRWPSHFARVNDTWWLNIMRTDMNEGEIYIFDDDWQFVRALGLPREADPIALITVGDEVWISDWNNDSVRRYTVAGEPLSDLESAGLEQITADSREKRLGYRMTSYAGIALFLLVLAGLGVRGLALNMNRGSS